MSDSHKSQLLELLDSLITIATSTEFDDGVLDAMEEVHSLPDTFDKDMWLTLDDAFGDMVMKAGDDESDYMDGVVEASRVAQKFLNNLGPKWYIAEPFQLGADVLDGWEGRSRSYGDWFDAGACRFYERSIFEVRQKPEETHLVRLPESVVRYYATTSFGNGGGWVDEAAAVSRACKAALGIES